MKHYLKGLAALMLSLLVAVPAFAGWNLRQNADGTTDWVRTDSKNAEDSVSVGEFYLTLRMTNITSPGTFTVAVPITDVKVTLIQAVLEDAITGTDTLLSFYKVGAGQTIGALTNRVKTLEISNSVSKMALDSTTPLQGTDTFAFATTGTVYSFTPNKNNTLEKGSVIFINTDGGSSSLSPTDHATIIITLKKR